MDELGATASAIINFAERLEDDTSRFYQEFADRFAKNKERFLAFVEDSKRNKELVIRTYRETITDALEACFSFKGLNLGNYKIQMVLPQGASYSEALKIAMRLEENAYKFYTDVAECGKSLLATIPRALRKAAETRNKRILELRSILDSLK